MYESPIITAEIKSQKGFFVGDPCYALTRSMYENLWGKQHGYKDGVFIDPVSRLTFAVAGTAEGDGCYRGSDDSNFPVDSGTIGIIPLELADREPGKGYGKYISQKDENFEKNYAAARKAGLNIGTYWYSYALTEADALAEAKTFLEAVKGKMFEYPLAFDIEDASQSELPNAAINKIIEVFCDYLESNGYYAAVYSYANFFKRKVSDSVKSRYDIWVAHFDVAKPAISNYGMWQYTSKGTVNGVSDRCDCNYAYKDYPAIMKKKCLNLYPSNAKNLDTTGYKKGDKGNGVLALKYLLMLAKKKGMHNINLDKNDIFGAGTQKAVNNILKSQGFSQNGIAGKKFIDLIGNELLK